MRPTLLMVVLLLLSACPSGSVIGLYTRSQENVTLNSRQKCEGAAEVVKRADLAVELIRAAFTTAGLETLPQSRFPTDHIWLCLVFQAEGCGAGGLGTPTAGCNIDSVVKVPRMTPPLCSDLPAYTGCAASIAKQSSDYVPQLVHELIHALDPKFDVKHERAAVWGMAGIEGQVIAKMREEGYK
jgi:hypothetical protein